MAFHQRNLTSCAQLAITLAISAKFSKFQKSYHPNDQLQQKIIRTPSNFCTLTTAASVKYDQKISCFAGRYLVPDRVKLEQPYVPLLKALMCSYLELGDPGRGFYCSTPL